MLSFFRNEKVIILLLGIIFFASRLYHLTLLPIFTDESIYIYWAKYILTTHSHWFIALTDGKPPVLTWIIGILLGIFPGSWYLVAGRLPSVMFGFITLCGAFFLSKELFANRVSALFVGVFIIFSPFLFVYERLALYDAQLCSMLIWSVYFCVKAARTYRWKYVLLWGVFLGLAFLSKPPALLYLLITPVCFIIMAFGNKLRKSWKKTIVFLGLVVFISELMNNLQRVSGAFHAAEIKNQQFQQPLGEFFKHPLELVFGNMQQFVSWLMSYYTLPIFLAALVAFVILIMQKRRVGIILFVLWLLPIIGFALIGREIFPRYLLFVTPYALIAISGVLGELWNRKGGYKVISLGALALLLIMPIFFCYQLLQDPREAPMPLTDYNQLVAEHPSGYGLDRVFSYIRNEEKKGKVTVVTQGTFGLYPYAFYLEFWGDPNVRILPKWPLDKIDEEIVEAKKTGEVLVVLKDDKILPPQLTELELLETIAKPHSIKYPILLTKMR